MKKINIKIVEVDESTQSVEIKYTSERSLKPIDEYPSVVFQVSNYNVSNFDEFIEAIRPQLSLYVYLRDLAENPPNPVDMSDWNGLTIQVDAYELPTPALPAIEGLANPEVQL